MESLMEASLKQLLSNEKCECKDCNLKQPTLKIVISREAEIRKFCTNYFALIRFAMNYQMNECDFKNVVQQTVNYIQNVYPFYKFQVTSHQIPAFYAPSPLQNMKYIDDDFCILYPQRESYEKRVYTIECTNSDNWEELGPSAQQSIYCSNPQCRNHIELTQDVDDIITEDKDKGLLRELIVTDHNIKYNYTIKKFFCSRLCQSRGYDVWACSWMAQSRHFIKYKRHDKEDEFKSYFLHSKEEVEKQGAVMFNTAFEICAFDLTQQGFNLLKTLFGIFYKKKPLFFTANADDPYSDLYSIYTYLLYEELL